MSRQSRRVVRYAEQRSGAFWIDEGLFIVQLANAPDDPALSVDEARVPPGVTTALHTVSVDERYLLHAGAGEVQVGGQVERIGPGDIAHVPAGVPQRITNPGQTMMRLWCLCTPRYRPGEDVQLEPATLPYEQDWVSLAGGEQRTVALEHTTGVLVVSGAGELRLRGGDARPALAGDYVVVAGGTAVSFSSSGDREPFVAWRRL